MEGTDSMFVSVSPRNVFVLKVHYLTFSLKNYLVEGSDEI